VTKLGALFSELRATAGCFSQANIRAIEEIVATVNFPDAELDLLIDHLQTGIGPEATGALAVRSSGVGEDSRSNSFAGIYTTLLNVKGREGLRAAVVRCWRDYYTQAAIAARLNAHDHSAQPGMGVLVQMMVPALLSGVAFTGAVGGTSVHVEYVPGLGEGLVSGVLTPKTFLVGPALQHCGFPPVAAGQGEGKADVHEREALLTVVSAVHAIRDMVGEDIDVEWAWDGAVFTVLQVRPVTRGLPGADGATQSPFYSVSALYDTVGSPTAETLGQCAEIYAAYVGKRADAYRSAKRLGVQTGAAYLLRFDGPGLEQHRQDLETLMGLTNSDEVVLDLSPSMRQIILAKSDLHHYFRSTFFPRRLSPSRHTVIIRDFWRGQFGAISSVGTDGSILLEYSADGLLAMNRGISNCSRVRIADHGRIEPYGRERDHVIEGVLASVVTPITALTRDLHRQHPGTHLEWVLHGGTAYFVDYSRTSAPHHPSSGAGFMISAGTADGPLVALDCDDLLRRLSISPIVSVTHTRQEGQDHAGLQDILRCVDACPRPPIVWARHPYAILSYLLDRVAGFVFEEGSMLCHLSLLLRERGLPAITTPGLPVAELAANQNITLRLQDGVLTLQE
jgi:hypothetical protein